MVFGYGYGYGYGYGDHGGHPVTEEDPFGPCGNSPVLEGHLAAMRTKEQPIPSRWRVRRAPVSYAHTVMSSTPRVSTATAGRELGGTPGYGSSREGLAAIRASAR